LLRRDILHYNFQDHYQQTLWINPILQMLAADPLEKEFPALYRT
jgi:hypothetical protein